MKHNTRRGHHVACRPSVGRVPGECIRTLCGVGQFRLQSEQTYKASSNDVTGLQEGDFVRIAGVEVGKSTRFRSSPVRPIHTP